jgi:glycosyltransferase involved in cell wall biosynthesis
MNESLTSLVSIVIPSYNHARYIGRALQSVLDQTYPNWEAIVVDNYSADNTDRVVASFGDSRITYLKIHNNGVIAVSRNAGILAAKGEWIAFLDSDDWWTNDKLKVCFNHIDEKVDMVYHDLEIVSDTSRNFRRKRIKSRQVKSPVLMDLLMRGNAIGNSSVVIRKSLLEGVGGINESKEMVASEDYNTWLRIARSTEQFIYLPCRLGYYFIHSQNASQKDMSVSGRIAVAEFIPYLSIQQKLKLEANFRYTSGRYSYLEHNYSKAKEDLWFAQHHGNCTTRLKALTMLIKMIKVWM